MRPFVGAGQGPPQTSVAELSLVEIQREGFRLLGWIHDGDGECFAVVGEGGGDVEGGEITFDVNGDCTESFAVEFEYEAGGFEFGLGLGGLYGSDNVDGLRVVCHEEEVAVSEELV